MSELPNRGDVALAAPSQQWLDHMSALGQVYDVVKRLPGASAPETCVISAGAVTPVSGAIVVDTESESASDDLNNIRTSNLPEGALALVRGLDSSRVVTLRDQAGGNGEFKLNDGDFVLDAADKWIILERRGSVWQEIIRGPVSVSLSDADPLALGVAAAGVAELAAREDHVHPRGALVDGPESATSGHVPKFADSTGKVLADGYTVGTAAGNLVQLDENAKLPAVDGSQLTNLADNSARNDASLAKDAALAAKRIALTAIAMTKSTGGQWGTVFGDEFLDETKIASKTGANFASGYYHSQAITAQNTCTGGSSVASSTYPGYPANGAGAFNGNYSNSPDNNWNPNSADPTGEWCGYHFSSTKAIRKIKMWQGSGSAAKVSSVKIIKSDDGSSWTEVQTFNSLVAGLNTLNLSDYGSASYWAIKGNSNTDGGYWYLNEIEMYEADTYTDNMTLISTAVSELRSGTVKSFLIGLEYEPIDAVTLGTDLKLYASRDNGNTWIEATYSPVFPFLSGKNFVTADVDVSAQASGSSLKWKLTSHNTKQMKIHGITVYPNME